MRLYKRHTDLEHYCLFTGLKPGASTLFFPVLRSLFFAVLAALFFRFFPVFLQNCLHNE